MSASALRTPARTRVEQLPRKAIEDQVISWWTALSAFVAAALILVAALLMTFPAGFFGTVVLVWLYIAPFSALVISLALFLVAVAPPRTEEKMVVLMCLTALLFVPLGVVASVVTLGVAPVVVAVRVILKISSAGPRVVDELPPPIELPYLIAFEALEKRQDRT